MNEETDALEVARMLRDDSNPGLEREVRLELIRARTENPQARHFTELGDITGVASLIVSAVGVAYQLYDGYSRSGKAIDVEAMAGLIGSALDRRQRDPAIEARTVQQVSERAATLVLLGRQETAADNGGEA